MSQPGTDQEPLQRIAHELRIAAGRLADASEMLATYATTQRPVAAQPSVPPPPPAPSVAPGPAAQSGEPSTLAPVAAASRQAAPPALVRGLGTAPMRVLAQPSPRAPGGADQNPSLLHDEPNDDEPWTWDRWGGRVLAWVGGAVTVLGVVLLLVLAVQRGWLGPGPRLLCGVGLAAVLLAASLRVHRSTGGRIGAFALAATGFTALYLDAVAATVLYHYLPTIAGLLAALVIAGAGLLLAHRWTSPSLAMFVVLAAAACAPLVTHAVTPMLVAFLLVLAGAATPLQLRWNWPYLAIAAEGPPLVFGLVLDRIAYNTGVDVPATVAIAVATLLLCVALAVTVVVRAGGADPLGLSLLLVSPIQVMAAAPLLPKWPAVASLAGVSALLFGMWVVNRVAHRLPPQFAAVAGGVGTLTLCQATFMATSLNTATLSITLLCQSMVFAAAARQVAGRGTLLVAVCYGVAGVATALAGPVRLTLLLRTPVSPLVTSTLRTAAVVAVLVLLVAVVFGWAVLRVPVPRSPGVWTGLGILALYGFSSAVVATAMLVSPNAAGFHVGHLVITVGWTVGAFVLLAKGINALPARIAGLALVGAALLKLFTFDLVRLDGIVRASVFLCTGVVLLVAGVRYAKLIADGGHTEPGTSTSGAHSS